LQTATFRDKPFVEGRIMDFSKAWTVPKMRLDKDLGFEKMEKIQVTQMDDCHVRPDDSGQQWHLPDVQG
jgi:hypothetical protein